VPRNDYFFILAINSFGKQRKYTTLAPCPRNRDGNGYRPSA